MGFRYRKTFRVSKRTKLNLGTQRSSMSVGQPGATVNLSRRGVRATVGLPGTGLSYTTKPIGGSRRRGSVVEELLFVVFVVLLLGILKAIGRLIAGIFGLLTHARHPSVAAPVAE